MAEVECTCRYCGARFSSPRGRAYCTASHRTAQWAREHPEAVAARYARKYTSRSLGIELRCANCGEAFRAMRSDAKFCSSKCRGADQRRNNGDEIRTRHADWARTHLDASRTWRASNREALRAASRRSYRRRREANPDAFRAREVHAAHVRRAREQGVQSVPFMPEQLAARYALFGFRCWMCGADDRPLHMDHVKPISRGGPHMLSNIRPACKPCNSSKHDRWDGPHGLSFST